MKLSSYLLLLFAVVSFISCKSSKELSVEDQGEVLIEQYCSEDKYFSDTYFPKNHQICSFYIDVMTKLFPKERPTNILK